MEIICPAPFSGMGLWLIFGSDGGQHQHKDSFFSSTASAATQVTQWLPSMEKKNPFSMTVPPLWHGMLLGAVAHKLDTNVGLL